MNATLARRTATEKRDLCLASVRSVRAAVWSQDQWANAMDSLDEDGQVRLVNALSQMFSVRTTDNGDGTYSHEIT